MSKCGVFRFDVSELDFETLTFDSQKHKYPYTALAYSFEKGEQTGKDHVHMIVEFKEPVSLTTVRGMASRVGKILELDKSQYSGKLWDGNHEWFNYMNKDTLMTTRGSFTFDVQTPEFYQDEYKNIFEKINENLKKTKKNKKKKIDEINNIINLIKKDEQYKSNIIESDLIELIIKHYFQYTHKSVNSIMQPYRRAMLQDMERIQFALAKDHPRTMSRLKMIAREHLLG